MVTRAVWAPDIHADTAHEPTKCLACGILTDATYCADCTASGQAAYDRADRAGDDATARSMEPWERELLA